MKSENRSSQKEAPENPSVLDKNTQFVRKHETGIFEGKGESAKREVGQSAATLGRHVKSANLQSPAPKYRPIVRKK